MINNKLNHSDPNHKCVLNCDTEYRSKFKQGIDENLVKMISRDKNEPHWLLEKRLQAYVDFLSIPYSTWGPDIDALDLNRICFYAKAFDTKKGGFESWDALPKEVKKTFDNLGIPNAEKQVLAGVGAQYESEVVYHSLEKELEAQGVIFMDMDLAIRKHPELVKKYFSKCISIRDHKFSALHYSVWSGGTFLYIPKGVKIEKPLQSYFRMNAPEMGQFEHTIIIVEEGAEGHYIEGCSAPSYGSQMLHAGCVEIFVHKNAKFRYSSVENWSLDTYNLNTKRAIIEDNASIEWVGGNMGSAVTMLYPCSILKGKNARADHLGIAFANSNQTQDTGAKVYHIGENTSSRVIMKSLCKDGGSSVYRGNVHIMKTAKNAISQIECDTLILDDESISDTIPNIKCDNDSSTINHEARVGKLNEEDIFYLTSRGIPQNQAETMIVNGFVNPIVRELPLEYAVEMNRLIQMEMK